MPAETANERPRPPGRRSIQLYGPPPTEGRSAQTPPSAIRSALLVGAPGFGSVKSTTHPTHATATTTTTTTTNATTVGSHPGLPSAVARRRISAVSSVTAAGSGEGRSEKVDVAFPAASPRHLRGRLNEGTVHRAVQLPHPPNTGHGLAAASSGKGPRYGSSVVSWVPVAGATQHHRRGGSGNVNDTGSDASLPQSRRYRGDTAVAIAEMVNEASLRNTWAMRFDSTEALRLAVSTEADAYTQFEEALVAELNALRRAPASYAGVVEREARVGAPYVREDDMYFASESAAEEAATQLRRSIEVEAAQEAAAVGTVAAIATTTSGSRLTPAAAASASNMSPKHVTAGHSTSTASAASGTAAAPPSPTGNGERKKTKKRHSGNTQVPPLKDTSVGGSGADGSDGTPRLKSGDSQPFSSAAPPLTPRGQHSSGAGTQRPSGMPSPGVQELTLAELRQQFRCQQRYRAALETAVRELRAAQRQAEAAQLAAWTAEDEKAQKRARRSTGSSLANPGSAATMVSSTFPGTSGVSVGGGAKKLSMTAAGRRGSPAMDEAMFTRRSEEAAQIHRAYEQRVHRLDSELQRARGACQRSLAGGNLISSAVRALRDAQPAPPLRRSRGLSLAARDTAEVYYGDEERVAALRGLYAISRATLVGLSDIDGGAPHATAGTTTTTTPTLEALARATEHLAVAAVSDPAVTVSAAGVLPVLSEEALLLAQVAQRACTTYGYISNEIRGVHLQGVGSPRTLLLQLLVGCLTPVIDITHQAGTAAEAKEPAAHANGAGTPAAAGDAETATQYFAGVRLEGTLYAADPDAALESASETDAGASVFDATTATTGTAAMGNGALAAHASHTTAAASDAAQRLWPLLWPAASTIGCGWQQIRGWRHVPTYTAACQQMEGEKVDASNTAEGDESSGPVMQDGDTAVVCSTLLLASGFEEYEVGRACTGMTPAATRRVILELTQHTEDDDSATGASRGSHGARRAAVEVHSRLGVALLTPTMHPLRIPTAAVPGSTGGSNGAVLCVAVRVPYDKVDDAPGQEAGAARRLSFTDEAALPSTIRIVAQVTRQSDPTPLWPSANASEVLSQRSPVDPSVWLIFVDPAAAFSRCGSSSTDVGADDGENDDGDAAAPPSLALHLFAKDQRDATGGYEHVAFIRLQQGDDEGTAQPQCGGPPLLMAPEWRYLLKGLSGTPLPAAPTAAPWAATSSPSRGVSRSGGWAVLHEPLLGRDGIVLHPLAATFRTQRGGTNGGFEDDRVSDGAADVRDGHLVDAKSGLMHQCGDSGRCAGGDAMHVAIQLPAHANALWWSHRLAALHAARDKLEVEVGVEVEEVQEGAGETSGSAADPPVAQTPPLDAMSASGVQQGSANGARTSSIVPTAVEAEKSNDTASNTSTSFFTPSLPPSLSTTATGATAAAVAAVAGVVAAGDSGDEEKKKPPTGRATANAGAKGKPATAVTEDGRDSQRQQQQTAKGTSKTSTRLGGGGGSGGGSGSGNNGQPPAPLSSPAAKGGASFSGSPLVGPRRAQSFHALAGAPESAALRDYEVLLNAPTSLPSAGRPSPAAAAFVDAVGVHPSLQASHIALPALRTLNERLRTDAQLYEAHLQRIQPMLNTERERIATEAAKKKGKEQQRLQHDQDDMAREMAAMQHRVETFQHAVTTTWAALRNRERAQVLRRARLARLTEELARLEGAKGTTAAPRVALRLFHGNAVAVGSGRNVAAAQWKGPEQATNSNIAVAAEDDLVILQPQSQSAPVASGPLSGVPGVVYTASCTVPSSFSGQATLLIDDEVAVTWTV